jgi:hypothetical protein
VVLQVSHPFAALSRARLQIDGSRALTARSFALRAATLGMLDAGHAQVASSLALLERVRAPRPGANELVSSPTSTEPSVRFEPAALPGQLLCSFDGCARPPRFQPYLAVDTGDRRSTVRDLPVRVCAHHRPDLEALLRSSAVRTWLQWKLHALGKLAPETVRVFFQVLG